MSAKLCEAWIPMASAVDPGTLAGVWAGISLLGIAATLLLAWAGSGGC